MSDGEFIMCCCFTSGENFPPLVIMRHNLICKVERHVTKRTLAEIILKLNGASESLRFEWD